MKSDWQKTTLKEVCLKITDGAHASPKSVDSGLPMASVKDMTPYGINLESCRHISEKDFEALVKYGCQPEVGDVLVAKDGATALDTVCKIDKEINVVLLSSVAILRPDPKKVTTDFLRYYMDSPITRDYLKGGFITGAAIPRIVLEDFKRTVISYPSVREQEKITSILSCYDTLIGNNTRRIKILEEMAKLIYREWFVEFKAPGVKLRKTTAEEKKVTGKDVFPERWEVKKFGDVVFNYDSKRKPISSMKRAEIKGEFPYYGAAKIVDYVNDYIFDGKYLLIAEDGSVITPDRKPMLQLVNCKFWPNNHTHVIQGKGSVSTDFLYLRLSDYDISGCITGAAQPKITQENLNRIPIVVANGKTMSDFDMQVGPQIMLRDNLDNQNKNLRQTRNLLLPKLVSGEVEV